MHYYCGIAFSSSVIILSLPNPNPNLEALSDSNPTTVMVKNNGPSKVSVRFLFVSVRICLFPYESICFRTISICFGSISLISLSLLIFVWVRSRDHDDHEG